LHGFGFAGALSEVGLPQTAIPVALICFNLGVEAGQLLFIATVYLVGLLVKDIMRRLTLPSPAWTSRAAPYTIGSIAMFWLIQRLAVF
jgi:hypothetical protein